MAETDFTKIGKAGDDIALIDTEVADGELSVTLTKSDGTSIYSSSTVAVDSQPTQDSTHLVTSGGVYNALQNMPDPKIVELTTASGTLTTEQLQTLQDNVLNLIKVGNQLYQLFTSSTTQMRYVNIQYAGDGTSSISTIVITISTRAYSRTSFNFPIPVDTELSPTSTNPVQNKAIYATLFSVVALTGTSGTLSATQYTSLTTNRYVIITNGGENYYYAANLTTSGYITYSNVGYSSAQGYYISVISINTSTKAWTKSAKQIIDVPTPTAADSGKVLGVNSQGKYALQEAGGGGGGTLYYHNIEIEVSPKLPTTPKATFSILSKSPDPLTMADLMEFFNLGNSYISGTQYVSTVPSSISRIWVNGEYLTIDYIDFETYSEETTTYDSDDPVGDTVVEIPNTI